jgi:hypothetical protein
MAKASTGIEVKIDNSSFNNWVRDLYKIDLLSKDEIIEIYDEVKYQGFNREDTLKDLYSKVKDHKLVAELIILCAVRGPVSASRVKLSNNKTPEQMGIPASGLKGKMGVSCARITSATADLAAYYLRTIDIPKRLFDSDCPSWLQFPSAGAIKLPEDLRKLHVEFSKSFSKTIGGEFKQEIYAQMVHNAYYDPKLKLF